MYNCYLVMRNSQRCAYFKTEDAAEMYLNLMRAQFGHLSIEWEIVLSYVDGLYW